MFRCGMQKALMEYAKSTGTEDRLYTEMRTLSRSFEKHSDLRAALENPVLPVQEKFRLSVPQQWGMPLPGRELSRFITLVLKNRREVISAIYLFELSGLIQKRTDMHRWYAKLTTAVPVSRRFGNASEIALPHLLHAEMELQTDVDPSIEGGFIFDINDFRLDASIATQLKRVKQQFIDKNRRIV